MYFKLFNVQSADHFQAISLEVTSSALSRSIVHACSKTVHLPFILSSTCHLYCLNHYDDYVSTSPLPSPLSPLPLTTYQISPVPGVLIYRFLGPVCFVNSRVFRARLEMTAGLYGKITATQKDGCLQQLYQSVNLYTINHFLACVVRTCIN